MTGTEHRATSRLEEEICRRLELPPARPDGSFDTDATLKALHRAARLAHRRKRGLHPCMTAPSGAPHAARLSRRRLALLFAISVAAGCVVGVAAERAWASLAGPQAQASKAATSAPVSP